MQITPSVYAPECRAGKPEFPRFRLYGPEATVRNQKQGLHRGLQPGTFSAPLTRPGFDSIFMVKIRLKRTGAKNSPVYRVVVADSRSPRDGKFIEELGTYHPSQKAEINFTLDVERAKYWLSVGAQASETVASMIKKAGKVAA